MDSGLKLIKINGMVIIVHVKQMEHAFIKGKQIIFKNIKLLFLSMFFYLLLL